MARPPERFTDPHTTANGDPRAWVDPGPLRTVWIATGTLCNLACDHCYIESSPTNDRLAYVSLDDVRAVLDEIRDEGLPTRTIGFTGGEPFLNRDFVPILALCLERGFDVLVLTNAMRPMQRRAEALRPLIAAHRDRLTFRVSLDHHTAARHEAERGPRSWQPATDGIDLLVDAGATVTIAGRTRWDEPEPELRAGYARLFADRGWPIDASRPDALVLFPEMDPDADVPEITTACWGILGKSPEQVMCHDARMVVKRKGADHRSVVACTLLPYEPAFDLGPTLAGSLRRVYLNHPHCATFCVLGGASCAT